jgi:hypothetical protein
MLVPLPLAGQATYYLSAGPDLEVYYKVGCCHGEWVSDMGEMSDLGRSISSQATLR